jgi:hypothetical protein
VIAMPIWFWIGVGLAGGLVVETGAIYGWLVWGDRRRAREARRRLDQAVAAEQRDLDTGDAGSGPGRFRRILLVLCMVVVGIAVALAWKANH